MATYFTQNDGVLLIWLLIAHIATDFILQTKKGVENKYKLEFKSWFLYVHVLIAGITVLLASGFRMPLWVPLFVAATHLIIDVIKIKLDKKESLIGFVVDQLAHLAVIIIAWLVYIDKGKEISQAIYFLAMDYKIMLIVVGYLWVVFPTAFIIKFSVEALLNQSSAQSSAQATVQPLSSQLPPNDEIDHAGKYIGIFERIIILTLVLFNQYEAIGFLITGKSIIRLNSKGQTEYVLAGTLMSYAMAIITGAIINWLLTL